MDHDANLFPVINGETAIDIRSFVLNDNEHTQLKKVQLATFLPPFSDEDESIPLLMRLEPRYDAWLEEFEAVPTHLLVCERMWPRCYELFVSQQVP